MREFYDNAIRCVNLTNGNGNVRCKQKSHLSNFIYWCWGCASSIAYFSFPFTHSPLPFRFFCHSVPLFDWLIFVRWFVHLWERRRDYSSLIRSTASDEAMWKTFSFVNNFGVCWLTVNKNGSFFFYEFLLFGKKKKYYFLLVKMLETFFLVWTLTLVQLFRLTDEEKINPVLITIFRLKGGKYIWWSGFFNAAKIP